MRPFPTLLAVAVLIAGALWLAQPAHAADYWLAKDTVGADAGTLSVLTVPGGEQVMLRCDNNNHVRYRICAQDAGCSATTTDAVIDTDKNIDICVPGGNPPKTKLGLYKLYDGGNPTCNVYKVFPITPGLCPK